MSTVLPCLTESFLATLTESTESSPKNPWNLWNPCCLRRQRIPGITVIRKADGFTELYRGFPPRVSSESLESPESPFRQHCYRVFPPSLRHQRIPGITVIRNVVGFTEFHRVFFGDTRGILQKSLKNPCNPDSLRQQRIPGITAVRDVDGFYRVLPSFSLATLTESV